MRTFTVTRTPRYEGYDDLHGTARTAPDEFLILVDDAEIGGTYWCSNNPAASAGWGSDDGGLPGESWASWGPRGLSCGHPSREAAEQAQVREYATDPDGHDRQLAMASAEQQAEEAQQQAEREAQYERREAARRRERLGDDEPGPTVWTLPAYYALYADKDDVLAVADWLEANGIEDVSERHEVRVEQRVTRRVAVYEAPIWVWNGRSSATTETRVVTIVTDPPPVTAPDRPDLHEVFAEHWPARFPLVDFGLSIACAKCTSDAKATISDQMVPWPCPAAEKAIANGPAADGDAMQGQTEGAVEATATAREIAKAIGVGTRTRRFVLRDEYGFDMRTGMRQYSDVLAAIVRSDLHGLPHRITTVAYALRKCMVSGRMSAISENRIADYSPYQLCALVARIARECPETTIGGICDGWLLANHTDL